MHVGVHDAVIHGADHADELIAVPGRDDGLEVLQLVLKCQAVRLKSIC